MKYRLWVNAKRTILLRIWENGVVEIATREYPGDVWGTPVTLTEEDVT